jgi:hypothetical protein
MINNKAMPVLLSARRVATHHRSSTPTINDFAGALFTALSVSHGARAYYDSLRARAIGHNDALRRLSNRLVGILHGCLRRGTVYDEATAWPTPKQDQQGTA